MRRGLQIDHRDPYAATRDTRLENLARLCRWLPEIPCGYRYRGAPGTWQWIPPDEPLGPPDTTTLNPRRERGAVQGSEPHACTKLVGSNQGGASDIQR